MSYFYTYPGCTPRSPRTARSPSPWPLPPSSAPGERNLAGIDIHSKPVDVFALVLTAGQTLTVNVAANVPAYSVVLAPPGTVPFVGHLDALHGTSLSVYQRSCRPRCPVAKSGTYALVVAADGAPTQCTLQTTAQ